MHIGVAVAVEDGLLVPVVRFADQKSFTQISTEVKILAEKAQKRKNCNLPIGKETHLLFLIWDVWY